jgi:hypothetical protein
LDFNQDNSRIIFSGIDSVGTDIIGLFASDGITSVTEGNNYSFNIYPNPASNIINIRFSFGMPQNYKLTVFDIEGNIIDRIGEGYSKDYNLDYQLGDIAAGNYFIHLEYGDKVFIKQFIKE